MQVDVGQQRREHAPLRGARFCRVPLSIFHHTCSEGLLYKPEHAAIGNPVCHEFQQPLMFDAVEEGADVRVQDPADLALCESHMQRIERIMLTAPGPESIAESLEVRLVDGVEHKHQGLLHQFVFNAGDTQRPPAAVCLGYPDSSDRLWPVAPTVDATVQVMQAGVKPLAVFLPAQAIDAAGRVAVERMVGAPQ